MEIIVPILVLGFFVLGIVLRVKKGTIGEQMVSHILGSLPKEAYTVINDLLLNTSYGTTQIDHVLVSRYGIFVIETKFYKGWITGGENSEYWTKNVYGNKYQFWNPILQNAGHCRALKRTLGQHDVPLIPIVAFSGQARLMVRTDSPVLYWRQLKRFIRRYSDPVISYSEMNEIVNLLTSQNRTSKETKKEHKQYARSNARISENKIQNGICPRCGGQLVLRHGSYGRFYGCSNYPKCKFTMND